MQDRKENALLIVVNGKQKLIERTTFQSRCPSKTWLSQGSSPTQ
jgi:hypothetical protein